MLSVQVYAFFFYMHTLVSTESSFSIHALIKNVACIGYVCVCVRVCVCVCSRMQFTKVAFLCALMKNVSCTGYICSRMQLTESSFSICIDEKCCKY